MGKNIILFNPTKAISGGQISLFEFIERLEKSKVKIHFLNGSIFNYYNLLKLTKSLTNSNNVIYCNTFSAGFIVALISTFIKRKSVVVLRLRLCRENFRYKFLWPFIQREVDYYFANSLAVIKSFSLEKKNAEVFYNNISKPKKIKVIGFSFRGEKLKNFSLLLDALALCKDQYQLLVSGCTQMNISRIDKKKIKLLPDNIEIIFLGRIRNMSIFYHSIDCFISISKDEALSRSIQEAILFKKGILLSRSGGNDELIDKSHLGYVDFNAKEISEKLDSINFPFPVSLQNAIFKSTIEKEVSFLKQI